MRLSWIVIVLLIFSCKQPNELEKLHQTIAGKWLIIYPDHQLKNGRQEEIYARIQDSIVSLTGLKLISLSEKGSFQQPDSFGKNGNWGITPDKIVFIQNGGKGFDHFAAQFSSYKDEVLQLTEYMEAEGEKIELIWNLKKITGGSATDLFDDKNNEWRKKPGKSETADQIRKRLADMLGYYSDYYYLVTKESGFFVTTRVILPFKFYQHAIGMRPFDEESFFAGLFFNKQQAGEAYQYLARTIAKLKNDFPRKKNYVEEYAGFMEKMADKIIQNE